MKETHENISRIVTQLGYDVVVSDVVQRAEEIFEHKGNLDLLDYRVICDDLAYEEVVLVYHVGNYALFDSLDTDHTRAQVMMMVPFNNTKARQQVQSDHVSEKYNGVIGNKSLDAIYCAIDSLIDLEEDGIELVDFQLNQYLADGLENEVTVILGKEFDGDYGRANQIWTGRFSHNDINRSGIVAYTTAINRFYHDKKNS